MGSKTNLFLEILRLFGVNTRGIETVLDQFSGAAKKPLEAAKPAVDVGAYWDGEYGKFVLVDKAGKKIIDETFANVTDFDEGLAVIERQKDKGSRCGFIEPSGKFAFEPIYDTVEIFGEGLSAAQLNKKWGYIDRTGKTIIPFKYDSAARFGSNTKGQAQVREGEKWFLIDKVGNFVKACEKPAGWRE